MLELVLVLVLVLERVDGAAERPACGVSRCSQRCSGVVGQGRVERSGLIDRCPVRRDETCEGRVRRRKGRCGDNRSR